MQDAIQGLTDKILMAIMAAGFSYIVVSIVVHKGLAKAIPDRALRNSLVSFLSVIIFGGIFYGTSKLL